MDQENNYTTCDKDIQVIEKKVEELKLSSDAINEDQGCSNSSAQVQNSSSKKTYQDVKILDGGFASQLSMNIGAVIDGTPLWTSNFINSNPYGITNTHVDYLEAGSDYISTCTYQASVAGFMLHLKLSKTEALATFRRAVERAECAIENYKMKHPEGQDAEIVGSIGPYGAALHDGSEYTGNYENRLSIQQLIEWHRPRFEELMKAGIKTFAFETIPCRKEAEALIQLLSEYPDVKAWLSFSCKNDEVLANGENFQEVAIACYNLNPTQLLAVGVNCINPLYVHKLLEGINKDKDKFIPLVAYPNSGEKYLVKKHEWIEKVDSEPLYTYVEDWLSLGVKYIGSCCRTYDKDIKLIKKKVDELKSSE